MKTFTQRPALLLYIAIGLASGLVLAGCGSSGSSGSSTTSTDVSSLDQLPSTASILSTSSSSSSESALLKSLGKVVSGTPPEFKSITSNNADTYFWNGRLATIVANNSASQADIDAYWDGEGGCRVAQGVGFSAQQILTAGGSLCYLRNIPSASSDVTIVSGSATVQEALTQASATQITKVLTSNTPGQNSDDSTIFLKNYGSGTSDGSSGYAVDLWFCNSSNQVGGYEQIRLNESTGVLTLTSVHADSNGSFAGIISGSLTASGSSFIYNTTKDRSSNIYYAPADGSNSFRALVTLDGNGLLTTRNNQSGTFGGMSQSFKAALFSNLTSGTTSFDNAGFTQSGYSVVSTWGSNSMAFSGAVEFQSTYYAPNSSNSLMTNVNAEDFSNTIYDGDNSTFTSLIAAKSNFSCTTTPDYIVSMDFSKSALAAIATLCENDFSANMQFCDGSAVSAARNIVMSSQQSQFGACSTFRCDADFDCQLWIEETNPGAAVDTHTCTSKCCTPR
jgi:hypothetical protein